MLCYCKKCGRIVQIDKNDKDTCDYCLSQVFPIPEEYLGGKSKLFIKKDMKEQFVEEYIKSSPEFDQHLFDHRDEDLFNRRRENAAKIAHGKSIREEKSRVPKCPSCGSSNISKIGAIGRVVSVGILGLASSKIGKTHKCNNCGATW